MKKLLFIFLIVISCSKEKIDLPKYNVVFYCTSASYSITGIFGTHSLIPVNEIPSCDDQWTERSRYYSFKLPEGVYNISFYKAPYMFNEPIVINTTFTVHAGCNIFCLNTAYSW